MSNATMSNATRTLTLASLALATLLVAACGEQEPRPDDTSDQPNSPPSSDLTPVQVLNKLGVNTDIGARLDPDKNSVEADYHPLTSKRRVLAPLAELYVAGTNFGGVLEDEKNGGDAIHQGDDTSFIKHHFVTGRGDVDGDGRDEIVILFWDYLNSSLLLKIVDRVDGAYRSYTVKVAENVSLSEFPNLIFPGFTMSMAIGDLDDDGRDEVACAMFNTLHVFDDAEAGFAPLASKNMQRQDPGMSATILRLGIGTFFSDGKQRLLATVTPTDGRGENAGAAQYHIFKDGMLEDMVFTWVTKPDGTFVNSVRAVGVGDVDGDNLDEVVLNAEGRLWVMQDQHAGGVMLPPIQAVKSNAILLDVDGDGKKEIFDGAWLFKLRRSGVLELIDMDIHSADASSRKDWHHNCWNASVGDIDGDLREELVIIGLDYAQIFANDGADGLSLHKTLSGWQYKGVEAAVAANLDDDSLTLEYTGRSELRFAQPRIMAVLAAPPAYDGIGQAGGGTTFGKSIEEQTETNTALGVNLGFSVGAKAGVEILGIGAEVSVKNTFKISMNFTSGVSTMMRTTYSHTTGAYEDKVVFAAVPVDVYYYKVVGAADPAAIGTIVNINLPRQPQILSVTRDYYNANNGELQDVDAEVLNHTIGDPFSYPTAIDREAHLAAGLKLIHDDGINPFKRNLGGWINEKMVTVGEGAGYQTLTIEKNERTSYGVSVDLSDEVEAEISAALVVGGSVGVSGGGSTGVGFTMTAGEGFFVESKIGDIPSEHFTPEKLYRAGLYAYPQQLDDQQFLVVNYWVSR